MKLRTLTWLPREYVRGGAQPDAQNSDQQPTDAKINNQPRARIVNMISRGTILGVEHFSKSQSGDNVISFFDENLIGVQTSYNDAVVMSSMTSKLWCKESFNQLFKFDECVILWCSLMGLSKNQLTRVSTYLVDFSGNSIGVEDEITLPITTGKPPRQSMDHLTFTVVWVP